MAEKRPGHPKRGVRQRCDGAWKKRFLDTLKECGVVCEAVKAAGCSRQTAYDNRKMDPKFAEEWDEAVTIAIEKLEMECVRRAHDYSDLLLIFLLKANKPNKYRETHRYEVSGPSGGPVEIATPKERAERLSVLLDKVNQGERGTAGD